MSDAAERFRRALDDLGIDPPVRRFEEPVPSAAAAAERLGCDRAAIANSLLFEAGDGVVLVLASGAHRVDLARVAAHLGVGRKKVRRADPDLVLEVTGQRVGGVSPAGHPAALPTLVDHDWPTTRSSGPPPATPTPCSPPPPPSSSGSPAARCSGSPKGRPPRSERAGDAHRRLQQGDRDVGVDVAQPDDVSGEHGPPAGVRAARTAWRPGHRW